MMNTNMMCMWRMKPKSSLGHSIPFGYRGYVTPAQSHNYNKRLNQLIKQHDYQNSHKLIIEMHRKRIPTEDFTYSRLLRMYSDMQDIKDLDKTLKEMKKLGVPMTPPEFNVVLHTYCRKNSEGDVNRIWEEMKQHNCFDERSFGEIIRFYSAKKFPEKVKEFLTEMEQIGLEPTQSIITDVIYSYADSHWYKEAMDLYEIAKSQYHIVPSSVLLNLMLTIGVKTKDPKYMKQILTEMWEANIEPHPEHYPALQDLK